MRLAIGPDGKLIGSFNENPILNTLVYEVEFPDGAMKSYSVNTIAENILQQVDNHGHHSHMLADIIGARQGKKAIGKSNAFITTKSRRCKLCQTTMGWDLQVR